MSAFDVDFEIDDQVARELVQQTRDGEFSGGYVERDYSKFGYGSYAPRYSGRKIPRSEWDDLIKLQDDNESSPLHVHKQAKLPILDQNGLPYCWFYGTTAGVMNRYAASGIRPVPHLSATATAARGKNFRQDGGWAGEAIEYIDKWGIPTIDTWPEHQLDRKYLTHEMELDSLRHKIVKFEELPSQDFDALASVLLDPVNPRPVTLGLAWWGHLVLALRLIKQGRGYGVVIVNSWSDRWGDQGYGVLSQDKATAHEQIAIQNITPRAA